MLDKNDTFEIDGYDNHFLRVGTRLPSGAGWFDTGPYQPFTNEDRARVVDILNQLPIVEDPSVHAIDG
jgi:hypothetical protein